MGGQPAAARTWAQQAYTTNPTVQHTAQYAARLLDMGEAQAALALIDEDTTAPALVILRLRALQHIGPPAGFKSMVRHVDHHFRHDIAHGEFLHAREMLWFYLDVLPNHRLAKRLAAENWQQQKEIEDRMLLARVEQL